MDGHNHTTQAKWHQEEYKKSKQTKTKNVVDSRYLEGTF